MRLEGTTVPMAGVMDTTKTEGARKMGSVKRETRNEGYGLHEWDYVPLGEPRVVAKLIQGRSRLDASYYPKREPVS